MKQFSRILALSGLITLTAAGIGGCDQSGSPNGSGTAAAAASPASELDLLINSFEKTATSYAKTARKIKGGDVSLTLRYIDLGKELREEQAKVQQMAAKMNPQQAQRAAAISAKVAPYQQQQ